MVCVGKALSTTTSVVSLCLARRPGNTLSQYSQVCSKALHVMDHIVKVSYDDKSSMRSGVEAAAHVLKSGGVIALPTDTIYGLACSTTSTEAVNRIYSIKGRENSKPLAICVGSVAEIDKWAVNTVEDAVLDSLLPGPVTVVLQRRDTLNEQLNPGRPTVGVRVPDHPFVLQLLAEFKGAIALTSANISQQQSTLSVEEFSSLWERLDLVVDGGRITAPEGKGEEDLSRKGSTVINLSVPNHFSVIREGCACENTVAVLTKYSLTHS